MSLGKIFGGGKVKFRPQGINAGGLSGLSSLSQSPERAGAVAGTSAAFGQGADNFRGLRQSITPGLNASARLRELENARLRTTGNLRDNLSRRRALGSSFATDALARADAEFASRADKIKAEATLQEAAVASDVIAKETQARVGQFQSILNNMNFEVGVAKGLTNVVNQQLAANARQEAGSFLGNTSSLLGFGTRLFGLGA